jgi:hypothetical protein
MITRLRKYLASLPPERVVIDHTKDGHTSRIDRRVWLFFWRTAETHETQREFDDVLVNLGVKYFTYLELNMKRLGISRQVMRSRAGKFGKKVARKSVRG